MKSIRCYCKSRSHGLLNAFLELKTGTPGLTLSDFLVDLYITQIVQIFLLFFILILKSLVSFNVRRSWTVHARMHTRNLVTLLITSVV